jgi:hypothetical protein
MHDTGDREPCLLGPERKVPNILDPEVPDPEVSDPEEGNQEAS